MHSGAGLQRRVAFSDTSEIKMVLTDASKPPRNHVHFRTILKLSEKNSVPKKSSERLVLPNENLISSLFPLIFLPNDSENRPKVGACNFFGTPQNSIISKIPLRWDLYLQSLLQKFLPQPATLSAGAKSKWLLLLLLS